MGSMDLAGAGVDLAPVLWLHRHQDGYVSFAVRSEEDDWRPVFAVRADRLATMFPEIRAYLLRDSFVSVNAAYRAARRGRSKPLPAGIEWPQHRAETLRYLCACYCDLDFYRKGLTEAQAYRAVCDAVEGGALPPFSFLVNSGRGLWLVWLLHGEADPGQAHTGAFADNPGNHLQLYQRIHREIGRRLAWLGADPAATDAARYVRMPGSFRNDVEASVAWGWPEGAPASMATYSLQEMGRLLGLEPSTAKRTPAQETAPGEHPARRRGFEVANRNKLAAVRHLQALRGGRFAEGQRNLAAFVLAACLRANGIPLRQALTELETLACAAMPSLPQWECLAVIKSVYKGRSRRMSYRYIADQLAVTAEEAQAISAHLGKPFPAAVVGYEADDGQASGNGSPRSTQRMLRRLVIRQLVESLGAVPSSRQFKALLESSGVRTSHVTLAADLRALGYDATGPRRQFASATVLVPAPEPLFSAVADASCVLQASAK